MARQHRRPAYETDDPDPWPDAVRIAGYDGIACYVLGWETEPDEDTDWSGYEVRTGRLVCIMVGDDRRFTVDPDDVSTLAREEYCSECGQIGCSHDGLDRSELDE